MHRSYPTRLGTRHPLPHRPFPLLLRLSRAILGREAKPESAGARVSDHNPLRAETAPPRGGKGSRLRARSA